MIRHLVVTLTALAGDLSVSSVQACVLATCALVALTYWLALPLELPLWPAGIAILAGLIVGVVWESRRKKSVPL